MTPDRNKQLDEILLTTVENISTMSFATRNKVGAILYKDDNIISMGWNGMPSGFPNEDIEYINQDGSITTNLLVFHAESNAILKCAKSNHNAYGSTLYVSINPCVECSKMIIQVGIKRVVFREFYRITDGISILEKAGIIVERLLKNETNKS